MDSGLFFIGARMSQDFLNITIDDADVKRAIDNLNARLRNMSPIYQEIAAVAYESVIENFDAEGRPRPWRKLSPATIAARSERGHWPGKILQDTGRMIRSIRPEHTSTEARVSASTNYAARMHFGGGGVPARPFLMLQDHDWDTITRNLEDMFEETWEDA